MLTSRLCGGVLVTSSPPTRIVPDVGSLKPAIIRSVVVLPQPDGPEQREELAARDVEVEVVDDGRAAEDLGQAAQRDGGRRVGVSARCCAHRRRLR